MQILRLLADGLSNREVADRLIISVGTTKSHVHHIIEKMGADSRLEEAHKVCDHLERDIKQRIPGATVNIQIEPARPTGKPRS